MGRSRTRISRGLLGALVVVIALGVVFYFHNTSKTRAKEASARANVQAKAPVVAAPNVTHEPTVVTSPAPSSAPAPSTQPSPSSNTFALTTQTPSMPLATVVPLNSDVKPAPTTSIAPIDPPPTNMKRPTVPSSNNPLADGKAKMDAGDFLTARRIVNEPLATGRYSPADAAAAKQLLAQINQTVVFSPKRFADDEFGGTYSVQTGDLMKKIAANHDVTVDLLCRLNNLSDPRKLRAGATIKVVKGPFHALVTKHDFTMEIWLGEPYKAGSVYVTTFPVGLGRDDSTPTGKWLVEPQRKLKNPTYYSPRGEGVIAADDPKNPLGEYWIGLTGIDGHAVGKQSYGVHGTIEPDSIGKQSSMGCIRMRNEDVAQVFELLIEGKSTVTVQD